jgi:hypothetical protein
MAKKKEERNLAVLLFSFAFLAIILTLFAYTYFTYKEIKEVDMKIKIDNYIGFNLDNKYLEFGTILPGGGSERNMVLSNNHNIPLFVEIEIIQKKDLDYLFGNTKSISKEWVIISENNFILEEGQTKSIKFTIQPSGDPGYGNYTAKAIIKFRYIR